MTRVSATIVPAIGTDEQNVPAIAALLRITFPELEDRAFAVSEIALTKENQPNLPLAFVALIGIIAQNNSNNVETPMDLLETICIEFWFAPQIYKNAKGGESPFYAYQDYTNIMDRLFSALSAWRAPVGKSVRLISMATATDEFAQCISFKVSIGWRFCPTDIDCGNVIERIRQSVTPISQPLVRK